jgi:glycolate oxidase FAD binding subunit
MTASATGVLTRLEEIVGAGHVIVAPGELAGYEVDGLWPAAAARPGSAEEAAEVVRFAAEEKLAVIPVAGRTKLRIGAPPRRYALALDLARMNRVLAYDPGDLTLGVEAGVRFADLNRVLAEKGQFVPLAPPFADQATIGGILATNSSTPLRHAYGSMRDYLLGSEFINGEGVLAKSGGRVVKNVTGYDLHKLMIGALGTLGVLTRVNFRTFPLPRAQRTFVTSFGSMASALALCRELSRSPLQPSLVEAVDPQAAKIIAGGGGTPPAAHWSVVLAAAGEPAVVERHERDLERMAQAAHAAAFVALSDEEGPFLLGRIREFPKHVIESCSAATIFRISVLPTQMELLLDRARQVAERSELSWAALVRASGIVFLALLPPQAGQLDAETLGRLAQAATEVMHACSSAEIGARPMIEWCPVELKREVNVWGPARDDLALMRRLKKVFDPKDILNPGRFFGGI